MRSPLLSLFAAIGFFLLGGLLVSPLTPPGKRVVVGPNGERIMRARTQAEIRADNWRVFRVNAPAYACFTTGALSFGWTLCLIGWGVVTIIRASREHHENAD
jgi:hypothetical protein